MELHGAAAALYALGNLGAFFFFGLGLLDEPLGLISRAGAVGVVWYAAGIVMLLGAGTGLLLGWRAHRRSR